MTSIKRYMITKRYALGAIAVICAILSMLPLSARAMAVPQDNSASLSLNLSSDSAQIAIKAQAVNDTLKIVKTVTSKVKAIQELAENSAKDFNADSLLNTRILPPVKERGDYDDVDLDDVRHMSKQEIKDHILDMLNDDDISDGWAVAIVSIVGLIFGLPLLTLIIIIAMILRSRQRYLRDKLKTMEIIASTGRYMPDDLAENRIHKVNRRSAFSSAVSWLGVGVGFMLFFGIVGGFKTMVIMSVIPLMIGAVKMVIYLRFDRYNGEHLGDGDYFGHDRYPNPDALPPQYKGIDRRDSDAGQHRGNRG